MYHNSYIPSYHSQPIAPTGEYSVDAAHALEDRRLPRHQAAFTATQPDPVPSMNLYSSPPTSVDTLEYRLFFQEPPLFPSADGLSTADSPDIERVNSQSGAEAVEQAPEDVDSDSQNLELEDDPLPADAVRLISSAPEDVDSDSQKSKSDSDSRSLESEDHPLPNQSLPADASRWISLSPAQFDKQFPGGNPFVIEELNMYAEEDPECTSYVKLNAACTLNRIFAIFYAVEQALFPDGVTKMHCDIIWGVVADLLKDGRIWLWDDRDEEECADLDWSGEERADDLKGSLEYVTRRLACSSLMLGTPRTPTWSCFRERVSRASFAMRVSVIIWAAFTSVSVREAGWERGLSDWTRCHVYDAFRRWHVVARDLVTDLIVEDDGHSQFEVAFKDTLPCHGHSCYLGFGERTSLKRWVHLQSVLRPTPSSKDVSLILLTQKSHPWWQTQCQQCNKLMKLYAASHHADYVGPSLSLVFLNHWRVDFDLDIAAWLIILAFGVSSGIISDTVFTRMDEMMPMYLDTGFFSLCYQPWVNTLPTPRLKASAVACSESDWRRAEHTVWRENRHNLIPASPWDSAGLEVRITALYLLMAEHSSQKLTPRKLLFAYYDMNENKVFDESVYYPAQIGASVEAFCVATSRSSNVSVHTCCESNWEALTIGFRKCYAAAYLLLHLELRNVPLLEPLSRPVPDCWCGFKEEEEGVESCTRTCVRCQELPVLPTSNEDTHPPAVPTAAVALSASEAKTDIFVAPLPGSLNSVQILPKSSHWRAMTLSKDVILPKLKDHFAKLLAQYDIPLQYTNLGAPQLPWCTLPQLLKSRHLEIAGWPKDLPLPDATGKHNAKGIMGLSAKDARRLYEALDGISFRTAGTRPREEDDIELRPTKKVRGMGKAMREEGEKKFRLSEVQTVNRGIRVEKFE